MTTEPLASAALAIATFRSDEQIIALLHRVFTDGKTPFGHVIVVDSLGSGKIAAEIERHGWPVDYVNADTNLGAAGNLAVRLKTAAATGATWCYAVNHDANLDVEDPRKLIAHGELRSRIGAVYPSLLFTARNQIEAPKRTLAPRAPFGFDWSAAAEPCQTVAWGSSNCALYNLQPIREDVKVMADLWFSWDDLALGWAFGNKGWQQIQCGDVLVRDDYEYKAVSLFGRKTYVTAKPLWYAYYQVRNMIIVNRRTNGEACSWYHILQRIVLSTVVAFVLREKKREWFTLFSRGIVDGFKGIAGKGTVP